MSRSESGTASEHSSLRISALRFHAKAVGLQVVVFWAVSVLLPPLPWMADGFHQDSIRQMLITMAIGLAVGCAIFSGMLRSAVRAGVKRTGDERGAVIEWKPLLFWKLALYAGSLIFLTSSVFSSGKGWRRALAVLCYAGAHFASEAESEASVPETPEGDGPRVIRAASEGHWGEYLHPGFVCMEFFARILHQSFLVFITDEGLRGWKFGGPVEALEPLLDDPEMTPGSPAFEGLMYRRRIFFEPYSEIESVEFDPRQKSGMGSVAHAGRLRVRFRGGRARELILVGNADGEMIRDAIASRIQPS